MDWFAKAFLKSSLSWLAAGATLGVAMAIHRPWAIYRPAHLHINLLGFVTMMIAGVGYHVIPRFVGHQLHNRAIASAHWWLANIGLALLVAGFMLEPHGIGAGGYLLAAGGLMSAMGIYLFVYNLWRTIDGSRKASRPADNARVPVGRRLPTVEVN